MRFYVATGLENATAAIVLSSLLVSKGWTNTYEWMKHGAVWMHGAARTAEVSMLELEGVASAKVVIALLPGGRGTHVELGSALGRAHRGALEGRLHDPRIIVHGNHEQLAFGQNICAFYMSPYVERMVSSDSRDVADLLLG